MLPALKKKHQIGQGKKSVVILHKRIAKRNAQWIARYGTDNPRDLPNGKPFYRKGE